MDLMRVLFFPEVLTSGSMSESQFPLLNHFVCDINTSLKNQENKQTNNLKTPKDPLHLEKNENLSPAALQSCSPDSAGSDSQVFNAWG